MVRCRSFVSAGSLKTTGVVDVGSVGTITYANDDPAGAASVASRMRSITGSRPVPTFATVVWSW